MRAATSEPAATAAEVDARTWLALAALTALGAALRLTGLGHQSLWNDELSSFTQYSLPTLGQVVGATPGEHIPGYWILMHLWIGAVGDDSESVLRLPSALFGIATIPAMFALGRRWYGRCEGLIAAGLVAVSWTPVFYSQEARPYALLLLAVVLATAWLTDIVRALRAGRAPTRGAMVGFVVATSTTAYAHYFGVLMVGLQTATAVLLLRRRPRALRPLAALYGAALLLYLPCLYRAYLKRPHGVTWLLVPDASAIWELLVFFFNQSDVIAGLVLAVWAIALIRALARGDGAAPETRLLVAWLVVPVAIVYAYSQLVRPTFLLRGLIIVLPPAYLLLARALAQLPLVRATAPALLATLLVHLVAVTHYYTLPVKDQFREAAAYLIAHDAPGTPALVFACAWKVGYFDYYLVRQGSPRRVERLAETAADAAAVQALIAERQPRDVWLLAGNKKPQPALLAALASRLTLVDEQHLKGAAVWHFRNAAELESAP